MIEDVRSPSDSKVSYEDILLYLRKTIQSGKSSPEKQKIARSNVFFSKPEKQPAWVGTQRSRPTLKFSSNAPPNPPHKSDSEPSQKRDSSNPEEMKARPNHFKRYMSVLYILVYT